MNNFALEIWDDESQHVTFYTVRRENDHENETDKFVAKFKDDPAYREALQELLSLLLKVIGDQKGAHPAFFTRRENHALALPPSSVKIHEIYLSYAGFPLRLFCYKISNSIVVLFNGGVKSAASAQESERLVYYFHQANAFAKRIEEALNDEILLIDDENERLLVDFDGNSEIYL